MKKICMIVQDPMVRGGIAAVVNGYRGSRLEKDVKVIYVESYKDGGRLTKLLKGIRGYFRFAWVLLTERPDLVHIHSSFGPSFYRKLPFILMASWAKKPIVNHIHGSAIDEFYWNASDRKKKLVRRAYGKCSRLIALSEEWKQRLSQIVPDTEIDVLENYSVLHEDALAGRRERSCANRVLFLGMILEGKGCYEIPEVAAKTAKSVPDVKFVLGGDGSEADKEFVRRRARELGVEDNMEYPGWVRGAEKDRLLRGADVFFLPSHNEGMPMSVLDAMGYGLAVVSTDVGGIPRIVHDGENGLLCAPKDTDGFAEALVRLLTDDGLRLRAGEASLEMVRERYSLEAHLDGLERIYREVLSGK